jgi:cytidylate kinase
MPIVTISRRVGSFGDVIAAIVAKKLNLELVTRERLHSLAQSCDPDYKDACVAFETEHGPSFFERFFFDTPTHRSLFEALTFEEAGRGNVVLVGRGSQIVLLDIPGVLKVRVVATPATRVARVMERYSYSRAEAEEFVRKYDHERTNLIRQIFDRDPGDWSLYDLIINTDHFSSGDAADVVIEAAAKMEKVGDEERVLETVKAMGVAKRIETLIRRRLTSSVARYVEAGGKPGGSIKLTGRIRGYKEKDKAEEIARNYPGVTEVENEIRVTELAFGL